MLNQIMTKHRSNSRSEAVAMRAQDRKSQIANRKSGFTLTELLVAIGLLLIIMLAVSTVFRSTGETVSVGLATIEMNRRMLTAQTTLTGDISGFGADPFDPGQGMWAANANPADDNNPPFLIIRNRAQFSFLDQKEWVALGSPAAATQVPEHTYRTDTMGFFSRGVYKRQTGGHHVGSTGTSYAYPLMDNMWGLDRAYVWYGHLRLPNNVQVNGTYNHANPTDPVGMAYPNPGEGTFVAADATTTPWYPYNPNNYFASQWILGRTVISLVQPGPLTANPGGYPHAVPDLYQNPIWYYGRSTTAIATDLSPLQPNSQVTCGDGTFPIGLAEQLHESRYDIAGLNAGQTWADYADIVNNYRFGVTPHVDWVETHFAMRMRANPFAIGEAADATSFAAYASQQVPMFMPGCTQFMVEFAGDYVTQQTDGSVDAADQVELDPTDPTTFHLDGVTDFDVVDVIDPNNATQQVRRIHWYGLPRRTDGSVATGYGDVRLNDPALKSGDVTTVSQMRSQDPNYANALMPFEWWNFGTHQYSCGWTSDMLYMPDGANPPKTLAPQLIRITIQISDPDGRVQDGMTRQFIFPVKRL